MKPEASPSRRCAEQEDASVPCAPEPWRGARMARPSDLTLQGCSASPQGSLPASAPCRPGLVAER